MAMKEKKGGSEQGRRKGPGNNFEVVQTNRKFLYYRISRNVKSSFKNRISPFQLDDFRKNKYKKHFLAP